MLFVKVDQNTNDLAKANCTPKKCNGDCHNESNTVKNQNSTEKNS